MAHESESFPFAMGAWVGVSQPAVMRLLAFVASRPSVLTSVHVSASRCVDTAMWARVTHCGVRRGGFIRFHKNGALATAEELRSIGIGAL